MAASILLACPSCTFSNPIFLVLSMFVGTVPCTYLLLRPHTRTMQAWGIPRIDLTRIVSLLLMLSCLIPLWFLGRQENSTLHVVVCIGCLIACCIYIWIRSCWLLDQHHVTATVKELLFPGLLAPGILVVGTTIGSWLLGILLIAPMWPMIVIPHTISSIAIGVPVGLLVVAGFNYTFLQPHPSPTPEVTASATSPSAEEIN